MHFAILLLSLLPLATAHFRLLSPAARGFNEDVLGTFPCGGQDTPSSNRTQWPLSGGPVQLRMGHDRAAVQVLLGIGNDVGSNFNITLVPTIQEEGLGQFCFGDVVVPSNLGITNGTNATIQVVTNGDPSGGLYNCADITFTTGTATPSQCTNGTGVTTTAYNGPNKNANGTNPGASTASGASGTPSASATAKSAAATLGLEKGFWGSAVGIVVAMVTLW